MSELAVLGSVEFFWAEFTPAWSCLNFQLNEIITELRAQDYLILRVLTLDGSRSR